MTQILERLDKLAKEAGRPTDELVREVMSGYVDEVAGIRETVDRRYDDIKSGKVKLISGDEIEAHFAAKSAVRRSQRS